MNVTGTRRFVTAKTFDHHVQDIASAAHLRGVVLTKSEQVVGSLEAAILCRTLRAAHENTRGQDPKHEHVKKLALGITLRLGVRGSVQVTRTAWRFLTGYASAKRMRAGA